MSAKLVVLAGRSLFTEGVISKLRRSSLGGSFEVIDMCQPDPSRAIYELRPDVVVVDRNDPEYCTKLKGEPFPNLSHLKMIFLDSQSARTRILQWEEHDTTQIADLLEEMCSTDQVNRPKDSAVSKDSDKSHFNPNLNHGMFH